VVSGEVGGEWLVGGEWRVERREWRVERRKRWTKCENMECKLKGRDKKNELKSVQASTIGWVVPTEAAKK
jgi:hypothetical protein